MNLDQLTSIQSVKDFLSGNQAVLFGVLSDKASRYAFILKALKKYRYLSLARQEKAVILAFCRKMTGYSRAQLTRLIARYRETGALKRHQVTANGFATKYTKSDIRLLSEIDELHEYLNGAAIKHLCHRAYYHYGDKRYQRLANISVSHLYNFATRHSINANAVNLIKPSPLPIRLVTAKNLALTITLAIFVLIPSIKAILTAKKAFIISMLSMK